MVSYNIVWSVHAKYSNTPGSSTEPHTADQANSTPQFRVSPERLCHITMGMFASMFYNHRSFGKYKLII